MNYIKLRKNNLCVENISALKLAKNYKTPFYCYSLSQIRNNYHVLKNAFSTIKPIICFAIKANSNLSLIRELKKMGLGADVVSAGELLKATKAGINPKKIVFSGFKSIKKNTGIPPMQNRKIADFGAKSEKSLRIRATPHGFTLKTASEITFSRS